MRQFPQLALFLCTISVTKQTHYPVSVLDTNISIIKLTIPPVAHLYPCPAIKRITHQHPK
jgi:hypothetical protein